MSSSKKKKRPSAGDDLINSLFDDISSKGSAASKARTKSQTTKEVDKFFTPVPELSEDEGSQKVSLELATPGKHDIVDPFEDFKRKRAAKARAPGEPESNTGSIPVLDLEKAELGNEADSEHDDEHDHDHVFDLTGVSPASKPQSASVPPQAAKAPFAGGEPLVTQMASRPAPTYEPGEQEELSDFSSGQAEQTGSNWKSDFSAVSAPDGDVAAVTPEEPVFELPALEEDVNEPREPQSVATVVPQAAPRDESRPEDEERTMRLVVSKKEEPPAPFDPVPAPAKAPRSQTQSQAQAPSQSFNRSDATEIREGVRVPPAPKLATPSSSSSAFTSPEAQLKQSESLRIAQSRISDLERELERLRRDNEALSTAGDTLRRRGDELLTKTEALEIKAREATALLEEERKIMRGQLQAKDRDNAEMRARVEEIETRLESNFKKIRVRERELEHRLEIVKMESATLVSTKDKMILDLKRQIDQLTHEHDYAKTKTQELFNQYKDKQETQRRVVRALRIALTILEGDDETVVPLKKVD